MVATDTVVGIVGAVVLVAVMVGVFVYEYNNTDTDGDSAAELQEHFEQDYPGLAATQDIDGDGTPNYEDADIDGDNVDNVGDDMINRTVPVSSNVPAPAGSPGTASLKFTVFNGTEHFEGSLAYTRAAGGQFPVVSGSVTGPAGFDAINIAFACTGSSCTWSYEGEEPMPAGEYTLSLSNTGAGGLVPLGQAATVNGQFAIHYATPGQQHSH